MEWSRGPEQNTKGISSAWGELVQGQAKTLTQLHCPDPQVPPPDKHSSHLTILHKDILYLLSECSLYTLLALKSIVLHE